ncbi:hypothetical protein ABZT02_39225 [Streptomyces sp. NPDC005402]|uniref:hypothetical protein n=1 Tax=Streptomyces sp. NPDC005402 TaxID=3155338 RepID=UPI0033A7DC60
MSLAVVRNLSSARALRTQRDVEDFGIGIESALRYQNVLDLPESAAPAATEPGTHAST